MSRSLFLPLLLLTIGAPSRMLAQAPSNQRQDVLAFVRAYVDAANRGDITAYIDMYAQRRDLITVSDGQLTRGWDALRDEANQMMGTEGAYRISAGSVDVITLAGDMAIAVFPFVATVSTQQGPVQLRGAMSLVVQKTPQGWRIIHDHTSSTPPGQ